MRSGRAFYEGRILPVAQGPDGAMRGPGGETLDAAALHFLPPCEPTKIVCVGRNYVEHAKELGNEVPAEPLLFLKAPSSLLGHGGVVRLPAESSQVEYEGEIALVVGRACHGLGPGDDPLPYLAGVTPLDDVTARDLQRKDVQFARAKSFDTFCPVGPLVQPLEEWRALTVRTWLNGRVVQEGRASDMAFPIPELVRYISRAMTLLPGDLIATGTPAGVGRLAPGDRVAVETAGLRLEHTVG